MAEATATQEDQDQDVEAAEAGELADAERAALGDDSDEGGEDAPAAESEGGEDTPAAESVEVREAQLPEAEPCQVPGPAGQLDILLDTTVQVTVRLGMAEVPARELIQLGPGSVLTLDKRTGEPMDLLLRGICFARGKLVIVGDQLGVKIEEILSLEDEPEG